MEKTKILVVVDMQNDFIDGTLGTNEAIAIVPNVIKKIENWDGPIIATYDTHSENYMNTTEGKHLPVVHCIKNTQGWTLNHDIAMAIQKKMKNGEFCIIEKPTFGSVRLPDVIKKNWGSDVEIELVGLCTDICVVSNALMLKANFYENEIYVDSKCCAGVTPASHEAALTTMKMCQINVI